MPLPFLIGRHADNNLVLRDNRASRNHARIFAENGNYVIEDLNSRHGTWVNGERVARHVLRNSDRIDFGVRESYQLTFTRRAGRDQPHSGPDFARLALRPTSAPTIWPSCARLVEVARALQNSLSTQEVLDRRGRRGAGRDRLRARIPDAAQGTPIWKFPSRAISDGQRARSRRSARAHVA